MMYEEVIHDFAQRTLANLAAIRRLSHSDLETEEGRSEQKVFEVTQLVNSTLGLLVFPQQKYLDRIVEKSLEELVTEGWPIPRVVGNYPQISNLRQLVRMLRNAISHFNLEFHPDSENEIGILTVWNTDPRTQRVTWKAELSISDLNGITERFAELLLNRETY